MPLLNTFREFAVQSDCSDLAACEKVLEEASSQQRSLIEALLDRNLVEERNFLFLIAKAFGFDWRDECPSRISTTLRDLIPVRVALRYHLLPLEESNESISLLTFDPFNVVARQVVAQRISKKIHWVLTTRRSLLQGLRDSYGVGAEMFEKILEDRDEDTGGDEGLHDVNVIDEEDPEASVINFVNQIIREALSQRATDIHVEPLADDLRIRYRIDGVLHEIPVPSQIKKLQASVVSRLKIMSHLDIAEKRLPQDGRINLEYEGKPVDVRVATIPTVVGESISLRLLGQEVFSMARLGLSVDTGKNIEHLLHMSNGIILLTGPTGCGKSTTLYTFLSQLNVRERRIMTIEDPVEHQLPGVMQMAIKPEINLTFATALRSILRGDPNVVMIGEMRDFETAEIAIRAALTGHLVFSTLHTNDAIGGITRLIDMGVEPFLVSSSVRAFLAQRLVRTLCPHCKVPAEYSAEYFKQIGFPWGDDAKLFKAAGCGRCRNTGFMGRTAILETCMITPALQDLITQRAAASVLRQKAIEQGMITLRHDGWRKVQEGFTTVDEVLRVTTTHVDLLDE